MTYKQTETYYEEGFGEVTIVVVCSDTYSSLMAQIQVDVDIFVLTKTKEDLDLEVGSTSDSSIEIQVKGQVLKTSPSNADNLAAYQFVEAGVTSDRYFAVFINPTSHTDLSALVMSGIMRKEIRYTDIKWNDGIYGSLPAPLREFSVTVQDFDNAIFDKLKMKNYVADDGTPTDGLLQKMNDALDPTVDVLCQYQEARNDHYEVSPNVFLDRILWEFVPLNWILVNLGLRAQEVIRTSIVDFNVVYVESNSQFTFLLGKSLFNSLNQYEYNKLAPYDTEDYHIKPKLLSPYTNPLVDWKLFKYPTPEEEEMNLEYTFQKYETFSDFLHNLAVNFGCFCRYSRNVFNEIRITFLPRSEIIGSALYIRDITKGDLNIKTDAVKEQTYKYSSLCNAYAADGLQIVGDEDVIVNGMQPRSPTKEWEEVRDKNNYRMLDFSLGLFLLASEDEMKYKKIGYLPRHEFKGHGFYRHLWGGKVCQTGLWFEVLKEGNPIRIHPAIGVDYWSRGRATYHQSLSDAVNRIMDNDKHFYEREYTLDIPFLNGFSLSETGSNPSWKNASLGAVVTLDTIEYVVVGIERNFENKSTTLRLHNKERFEYQDNTLSGITLPTYTDKTETPSCIRVIASEDIPPFNIVSLNTDGSAKMGLADKSDYRNVLGIAVTSGLTGYPMLVQRGGRVFNEDWNFSSDFVHLKSTPVADSNISGSPLENKTATEDMAVTIRALSSKEVDLDTMTYNIFYPPNA